jgi:hypothetical protein
MRIIRFVSLMYDTVTSKGIIFFIWRPEREKSPIINNNNTAETLRTIPGILIAAPDRTDRSNGLSGDPKDDAISSSTAPKEYTTCSHKPSGNSCCQSLQYRSQHSVVIVNPGGTDNPSADISAKLAPFPPKIRFLLSSVVVVVEIAHWPLPKGEMGVYSNPSSRPTSCTVREGVVAVKSVVVVVVEGDDGVVLASVRRVTFDDTVETPRLTPNAV